VDLPPDRGVSAFRITDADSQQAANFHNGNLGEFLAKVQAGAIKIGSVLILERLDRFSRNYWDLVYPTWLNLLQSGVEIYSCVSHTHYTIETIRQNPMLAGMALLELANANEYSAGMSKRIGKAFSLRLQQAATGQKLNLGGWQPKWVDFHGKKGQSGTFTLNAHSITIKRIVSEYLNGHSMYHIVKCLIRDKVPTLQGGNWSQGTIAKLLRHDSLIGDKTIKQFVLKRYYPPLITDEEYKQVKARLADNKEKRGGGAGSDRVANLFRNRCKCAVCGGSVCTQHNVYFCCGRRLDKCESKHSVKIANIEADFFLLFLKESPAVLLGKQTTKHNGTISNLKANVADIEAEIDKITALTKKLSISQLETKLTALVKQRDNAAKELEAANMVMLSNTNAPAVFDEIKSILLRDNLDVDDIDKALRIIQEQLKDNEVRKRLLEMLPSIVKRLEINTTTGQYRIVNTAGDVSAWSYVGD
jgi:hypothetical protein